MRSSAKFKPTGHRRPVHRPREYEQDTGFVDLSIALDNYLSMCRDFSTMVRTPAEGYTKALECIEGVDFTLDDVNWLALKHRAADKGGLGECDAGVFISACHNTLPDKLIINDIDMDEQIGFYLPEDKTLINKGALYCLGQHSSGLVVNLGTVSVLEGNGVVINYSHVTDSLSGSTNALLVTCGEAKELSFNCRSTVLAVKDPIETSKLLNRSSLTEAECAKIPELSEYLNNLRTDLETGVYHSKKEVETNIYDIIKRCKNG